MRQAREQEYAAFLKKPRSRLSAPVNFCGIFYKMIISFQKKDVSDELD